MTARRCGRTWPHPPDPAWRRDTGVPERPHGCARPPGHPPPCWCWCGAKPAEPETAP